jgi:hypothetical protein|eukprot:COSAG01_NODE_4129_length_5323_cov_6.730283_4_plen_62_part_00
MALMSRLQTALHRSLCAEARTSQINKLLEFVPQERQRHTELLEKSEVLLLLLVWWLPNASL